MRIVQELSFEDSRKVGGQGERGRRVREAEDAERDDGQSYANWQTSSCMAPTNDLGILFLATMEFGRNTKAFWLATIS